MKRLLALVPLLLVLVLAACTPRLRADVTRFHSFAGAPTGQSFVIEPTGNQIGSLAFQHYAGQVSAALARQGLRPLPPQSAAAADLVVLMRYGSAGQRTEVASFPATIGAPGWGDPWWGGPYPRGPYSGGLDAYDEDVTSWTIYSQFLDLQILDGAAWRQHERRAVFEAHVIGDSDTRDLNTTMPYLVAAAFDGFPGTNATTVKVSLPMR